jgi:hypothetical protein
MARLSDAALGPLHRRPRASPAAAPRRSSSGAYPTCAVPAARRLDAATARADLLERLARSLRPVGAAFVLARTRRRPDPLRPSADRAGVRDSRDEDEAAIGAGHREHSERPANTASLTVLFIAPPPRVDPAIPQGRERGLDRRAEMLDTERIERELAADLLVDLPWSAR